MPILSFRRLAAVLPAALWVAACGLDSDGGSDAPLTDAGSVQDAPIGKADGALPGDDGSTLDDGGVLDVTQIPDAPPPEACSAPTESCSDGVDNDCNGLVDCADPACGAFACSPVAPAGWTLLELAAASRPDCDPNFVTPTNLLEGVSSTPASCSCACTVTAPGSCEHGTLNVFYNGTLFCPLTSFGLDAADGACTALPLGGFDSVVGGKSSIAPLPYTAGTCTSQVTKTLPAPTFTARGRSCALPSAPGGGCDSGKVCAPKPSAAFDVCVSKAGDQTCPAAFPAKHLMGTGVTDARTCGLCGGCAMSGTCANATLTNFEDSNCDTTKGKTLTTLVDGQCEANTETSSTHYHAYKYAADVQNAQCTPSTSTPSGSVSLTGVTTICCP